MAQPTQDELAKMSLEELDALSPLEMSAGMQRAVTYYRAQRRRETHPPVASFVTPAEAEAQSIVDEPSLQEALSRTTIEVSIDGEVVCTAGLSDPGVLTAILTYHWKQKQLQHEETISLGVSGFLSKDREHCNWLNRELEVGTTITLRLIETDAVDEPHSRKRTDVAHDEVRERAYYEHLKHKFEKNE